MNKLNVINNCMNLSRNSKLTFTGEAFALIFPQETASSGRAPESLPSYSQAVFK